MSSYISSKIRLIHTILMVLLLFLYLLWGTRNGTCHFSVYLFFLRIPPLFLILVCAVSDVSCVSTLSNSLIKVKSLDKETLHLCLPASISSREGPTEVLGTKPLSF